LALRVLRIPVKLPSFCAVNAPRVIAMISLLREFLARDHPCDVSSEKTA
jgi:hypothetical protein